jgi:hypothetical protein
LNADFTKAHRLDLRGSYDQQRHTATDQTPGCSCAKIGSAFARAIGGAQYLCDLLAQY